MDEWIYRCADGISPHSTRLPYLSGLLPKKRLEQGVQIVPGKLEGVVDVGVSLEAATIIVDATKARFELVDGEVAGRSNGRKIVFVVFCHVTQKTRSPLAERKILDKEAG